jgi:MoxR-like ATPase
VYFWDNKRPYILRAFFYDLISELIKYIQSMGEPIDIRELNERIESQSAFVINLTTGMNQVIVGQKHLVESLLIGLLADGHILLEGVPGLAKTLAIKTLASLIEAKYSRIQFTPDLLPADVIGTMIYSQKDESFQVRKGPVFANFVLADEINRAPAKVQSALLEAMQERQVTIGGQTFILPSPFLVMATQNPIEQEGTYPLPEAQVDRFMLKVIIDYPKIEEEKSIIRENIDGRKLEVSPVMKAQEILEARKVVRQVYIDEKIEKYIVDIVFATREPENYGLSELKGMISFGSSPRASINLALASRAYAFIKRRGYVIPEDIRAVAHDVMRHRIGLTYEAEANNLTSDEIVSKILNKVEVP